MSQKMKTIEQLNDTINHLQFHIDNLLIRVQSCEQFIEKILSVVGLSNLSEYSSNREIKNIHNYTQDPASGYKSQRKSLPDVVQMHKKLSEPTQLQFSTKQTTSIKDFLLFPPNKQPKGGKQFIDSNSFNLIKNAILMNSHQIEQLCENLDIFKNESYTKFKKQEEAINILTKVITMIQQKLENLCNVHISTSARMTKSSRRNKSISKSPRILPSYY